MILIIASTNSQRRLYSCSNFISAGYGDKIKKSREQLGFTQREFASFLNVGPRTVGKWESAQSVPFRKNIKNILALIST